MKITNKIGQAIDQYTPGQVFSFSELGLLPQEMRAGITALSRMVKTGILKRARNGKYYKPSNSPFGDLNPGEEELLRTYLYRNGRRIAYITGPALYNRLGLTTQVPKTIQVASREKRITTSAGNLKVKPVKSYEEVSDHNYQVLGLLDAMKDFRDIPDRSTESALIRLRQLVKNLSDDEQKELAEISLKYPPRARALAGALLDWNGAAPNLTIPIADSLNPLSEYNFAIPNTILPVAEKWKIH